MPIGPLTPPGIKLDEPEKQFEDAILEAEPEKDETFIVDPVTGAVSIEQEDGGVIIDENPAQNKNKSDKFNDNLAEFLSDEELGSISTLVLEGIDNDIESRSDWQSAYDKGIQLMGLKLEEASSDVNGASVSKVYHPLLIEATVKYQSNAMAELLPASGPVKVRDDALKTDPQRDDLADSFEKSFNHYLTTVAKEYYPDTDQLLFNQGWSGMAFKKVFNCPIRKRPCSDYVSAPDLIVSNDAVDLETANRVTHRIPMTNSVLRRMQRAKIYRKVDLGQPVEQPTRVEEKIAEVESIDINAKLPADQRHTIYETYVDLDIPGYEEDIPLPYRVTIDKDSRHVLEIRRNWEEGDQEYKRDCPFVKFGMIPALGFYDLGFVHLLGNTARALTAILRMQLDSGQFSIFPGFLFSKQAGKQPTNNIRISPGTGMEIETGGLPIGQIAMPLPYQGPSQVLAAISEKTAEDGMRLGMASEITAGEGRADVPVGTVMALIEQATKPMGAVHRRNHVSQQREFEKLRKLFLKDPEILTRYVKNPETKMMMATAIADFELVPASDPNIPSHTHRLMQSNALVMLAAQSPQTFNIRAVAARALNTIGIKDIDSLLAPLPPPGSPPPPPPPEVAVKMAEIELKKAQMQLSAQQQAAHDHVALQKMQMETINGQKERESREKIEALKMVAQQKQHEDMMKLENTKFMHDMQEKQFDKAHAQKSQNIGILADLHKHESKVMADHAKTKLTLESQEKQAKEAAAKKKVDQD